MKPVDFPESTKILIRPASDVKKEVGDLRVFNDGQHCVSLWKPTWKERLSILVFGRVWLDLLSGKTQPPAAVSGRRSYFKEEEPEGMIFLEPTGSHDTDPFLKGEA